jgi:hypothetical protein
MVEHEPDTNRYCAIGATIKSSIHIIRNKIHNK